MSIDHKAALAWALSRTTGASATAIVAHLCGLPCDGSYPSDSGDFGRCERAMQMIPGLRERLPEMASVNRYWAALVPEWERIRSAPEERQYDLIQSIIRPAEAKDTRIVRLGGGASLRFGNP